MNQLLESTSQAYILLIVIFVVFAGYIILSFVRNKKFQESESQFQNSLKVGDRVKTYSGFYGSVAKLTNTTDGLVVTLKLGEGSLIDVDVRALMGLDTKTEVKESPVASKIADVREKEALAKEAAEKAKQVDEKSKVAITAFLTIFPRSMARVDSSLRLTLCLYIVEGS